MKKAKNLFITGTGTDVGKTYVAGLIVKKIKESDKSVAYYKAAMSGNERDANGELIAGDALAVKTMSGISQSLESMCPYVYENAVSPHLAAKWEGGVIEMNTVLSGLDKVCEEYDYVTAEGSGGIVCPLRFDDRACAEKQLADNSFTTEKGRLEATRIQLEDVIKARELPCVIVADAGLGTINAVVLTVEYMKLKNLIIKGIIFNNYEVGNEMHEDNLYMCEQLTGVRVLACVKKGDDDLDISTLELLALYE